jgi:hypothetical protein
MPTHMWTADCFSLHDDPSKAYLSTNTSSRNPQQRMPDGEGFARGAELESTEIVWTWVF